MLWGTEFDADALFGVDEYAGWMGTEEDVTEVEYAGPEAGFGAGLGSGQAVTESFFGGAGADCGFEMGVVGAVAGEGHALQGRAGVLGIEAGLVVYWETGSGNAAGNGAGAGGVAEGQDGEVQAGTESQTWTVV